MSGNVLEISGLSARYGHYDVLKGIDLTVREGEVVGLLGPNGAGKTTTLRAIMGLMRRRRGSIRIAGQESIGWPSHQAGRGHAALVPEGRRLFLDQSIQDNLELGAFHLRHDQRQVRELMESVFGLFPVLRELRALGMTVIIVEHQTQFVFNVCDNVTVLSSGKVVVSGEAAQVRQNDRVREVYLGL